MRWQHRSERTSSCTEPSNASAEECEWKPAEESRSIWADGRRYGHDRERDPPSTSIEGRQVGPLDLPGVLME